MVTVLGKGNSQQKKLKKKKKRVPKNQAKEKKTPLTFPKAEVEVSTTSFASFHPEVLRQKGKKVYV